MDREDALPGMRVRFRCPDEYRSDSGWRALDGCIGILDGRPLPDGYGEENANVRWQHPASDTGHTHDEPVAGGWEYLEAVLTEPLDTLDDVEKYLEA